MATFGVDVYRAFMRRLESRSPKTQHAYTVGIDEFRRFARAGTAEAAAQALLDSGADAANEIGHDFIAALLARGLAGATVNLRLAPVRGLIDAAGFRCSVHNVESSRVREVAAPSETDLRAMWRVL